MSALTRVLCSSLKAVDIVYANAGLPPVKHAYLSDQMVEPYCATHGFAAAGHETYRWEYDDRAQMTGKPEVAFHLIAGSCAPPSIVEMIESHGGCEDPSKIYGYCPPCGIDWDAHRPVQASGCVHPLGVDPDTGLLIWPPIPPTMSVSDHTYRINVERESLAAGFTAALCQALSDCYKDRLSKDRIRLISIDAWRSSDARFIGHRIDYTVST